ncbi:MAG: MaoC family dehydratase [Rhizobiaceae bacterium]|nr:MaoC family dehydratase [Rhizobiaceae bacterium]
MFAAFRGVGENRIRESVGLAFEDFAPGQIFHHRPGITVYQTDNANEALVTLNQAAVHYDEHYASKTEFGRPLVVSTLTLQRAVGMGWKTFGRRKHIGGFSSIRLTAPVYAGDTLFSQTKILSTADDASDPECGMLDCEATVTRGETTVAVVTYTQALYRRDRGPFEALGY